MKALLAALSFLAASTAALACIVPASQVPRSMWPFVYLMLVAMAAYAWRHPDAPSSGSGWLKLVLAAAIVGTLFAAAESMIFGRESGFVVVDMVVVGAAVLVGFSGAIYTAIQGKTPPQRTAPAGAQARATENKNAA